MPSRLAPRTRPAAIDLLTPLLALTLIANAAFAQGAQAAPKPVATPPCPCPPGWELLGNVGTNPLLHLLGTIGGGGGHTLSGFAATIAGGAANTATSQDATVAGGRFSSASGQAATIGGGNLNTASNQYVTVSGGDQNNASGDSATIGGGFSNVGELNVASGLHSFAAGFQAQALDDGAIVWADRSGTPFASTAINQLSVRAAGGTRIFSNPGATTGVLLAPGAGTWSSASDRESKENIGAVDGREVLERLAEVPIATWNYRSQDDGIRHMGPMAQDFFAAFGLGLGEKTIDTIDPDGVALAAIQGLNALVQEQATQIAALEARLSELEHREPR
ncbi:MAG: hypothetical protein HOP15_13360 [Planctomycetes bacterium]|nr:hypothetical protein [Planctomycetota bacterium]